MRATARFCVPTAMPITTEKITKAVSSVSRTTVRNLTMESAPTRLNASATFVPMICVTIAISTESSTSVTAKLVVTCAFGLVIRYSQVTPRPRMAAAPSRATTSSQCTGVLPASDVRRNSGTSGVMERVVAGGGRGCQGVKTEAVLRNRDGREPEVLYRLPQNRRRLAPVLHLHNRLMRDDRKSQPGEERA